MKVVTENLTEKEVIVVSSFLDESKINFTVVEGCVIEVDSEDNSHLVMDNDVEELEEFLQHRIKNLIQLVIDEHRGYVSSDLNLA